MILIISSYSSRVSDRILDRYEYIKLCICALMYNHHMNSSYASDVAMEPIYWIVDNYTHVLGPVRIPKTMFLSPIILTPMQFFVVAVAGLTGTVIYIAHWIGLPFYWQRSPALTVALVAYGYWLIVNITFHYWMAVRTPAGAPPEGVLIVEASGICRKCIAPKPPRTHHCSVMHNFAS